MDNSDSQTELLDKIWVNSKDRHDLFLDDVVLFERIKGSNWYKGLRPINKEFLDHVFIKSINKKERDVVFISSLVADHTYSLHEAYEILVKPLTVILENIEYDKYFIDAILRYFTKESEKVNNHIKNGWLVFENGGGNNIENVLNVKKQRFENDKVRFPKPSHQYIRTFVLIDSDKAYPSHEPSDKQNLVDILIQNTVYHRLSKREMENYMPDEVFTEIAGNAEFIKAYLELRTCSKITDTFGVKFLQNNYSVISC